MAKIINVFAGEMAIGQNNVIIKTGGIGSCMIVCLYDKFTKIGGLSHCMLPSTKAYPRVAQSHFDVSPAKYVDQAIDRMIFEMEKIGAKRDNMKAKLVGGAEMIKIFSEKGHGLGPKNVDVARSKLKEMKISIESESVGGTVGRFVELNLANGVLDVSSKM